MNAKEIVKNIIIDGINQSKELIWKRLLLPNFDVENPKNNFLIFNTPEDYKKYVLKQLFHENEYYEREYYFSNRLLNEVEYNNVFFSNHFKNYVVDYLDYEKHWKISHNKINKIENYRNIILDLINSKLLSNTNFSALKLPLKLKEKIWSHHSNLYESYKIIWLKSQTLEGKESILYEFERWWFYELHGNFSLKNILNIRERALDLELNYIEKWKQLIDIQDKEYQEWISNRKIYLKNQKVRKKEIDHLKQSYLQGNSDTIISLCKKVLEISEYNFKFDKDLEIDFISSTNLLLVEYVLPNLDHIPRIKEVKYLKTKKEFKNIELPKRELFEIFDETTYSIVLRSIYEIFINDLNCLIDAVNFNGWIKSINKATGLNENTCIISIQVKRSDFMEIELKNIEPKACFKFFKGIGSAKLYSITAIPPILHIQKDDKRFVDSKNIDFDDTTNLALMNWEDFEHLIRELFEKEFYDIRGQVKVTQASRDGGVDAIVFDPDPIRGGKIVIQAKRYTNTVGVAAVRDLYGTVMNEGANKGILVTTSDYGPDSYEFAKGKPLTLLNGGNLLHLLEKHGTKARINIKEAKKILNDSIN
ncbi:restriction endonuclease [Polaribacter sargassicola]|uniref:restriction endonuclease n=1 Tax=Polaribacter sargassicola TaxID=2836891 RepID=UPI001F1691D4|nr:restriction endonuclease [Polaribacter sp. DS7-9]MCG1036877.1 restriction endonuclease [Polaribacter sp. DS7-9]